MEDDLKRLAGRHAAGYVQSGMKVGLGTGSTVHHTIVALGERAGAGGSDRLEIVCTATSDASAQLATSIGLQVVEPDDLGHLDIAIDGADEVAASFDLTKGGGGAHTREKVVAEMSARFIVVVDEHKLVEHLGAFGTPVEVLPFAPRVVYERLRALGASDVIQRALPSDNGNLLADAHFGTIEDPSTLAAELAAIPGLVEHGLFPASIVERVVVASGSGVRELIRR